MISHPIINSAINNYNFITCSSIPYAYATYFHKIISDFNPAVLYFSTKISNNFILWQNPMFQKFLYDFYKFKSISTSDFFNKFFFS